jgi:hypothetical protein
LKRFVVGGR